jgi:hypothetical protein
MGHDRAWNYVFGDDAIPGEATLLGVAPHGGEDRLEEVQEDLW